MAKDVLATTLHELSREAKDLFDVLLLWAEEQASGHLAEFFFTRRDVRQLTDTADHRLRQALQEQVDMETTGSRNWVCCPVAAACWMWPTWTWPERAWAA